MSSEPLPKQQKQTYTEPIKDQLRSSRINFSKEFDHKVADEARRRCRLNECGGAVRDFVSCAHGRTVSAAWKCAYFNEKMKECLLLNNTEAYRARVKEDMLRLQGLPAKEAVEQQK